LIIFFQNQDHRKYQKMTRGILENEMLAGASIPLSFEMPHRHLRSVSILPKTLGFF
jgi:hypothetical protein